MDDPDLKITPEETQGILNALYVDNFDYDFLHTIVLLDDISNSKLFANESSYFSQLIRRCRHTNFSFFLLIQGWKGLKPHIKNEISTLFIFPCFNNSIIFTVKVQQIWISMISIQNITKLCKSKINYQVHILI